MHKFVGVLDNPQIQESWLKTVLGCNLVTLKAKIPDLIAFVWLRTTTRTPEVIFRVSDHDPAFDAMKSGYSRPRSPSLALSLFYSAKICDA